MIISKEIHLAVNTNSVPFMYTAYSVIKSANYDLVHFDENGKIAPIDVNMVFTERKHHFTSDNRIQMYSYLYQSGYSKNEVIED